MLKLSKYEIRKNLKALLILLGGLLLLEGLFQAGFLLEKEDMLMISAGVLFVYGLVCFFAVFIFAVTNYYRELNSRTSYLVFMTPVSCLKIVLSKMLTVLILGLILAGILCLFASWDVSQLMIYYSDIDSALEMFDEFVSQFGIHVSSAITGILFMIITFLISFFSIVGIIYLCITLSSTFLQNSRLKGAISVVLFLVVTWGINKVRALLVTVDMEALIRQTDVKLSDLLYASWPYSLFNLGVLVLTVLLTTYLLKKKLSL